jgi:hypothetical protein
MSEASHPENRPEGQPPGTTSQEVQHSHISARVPEKVGRGIFSNGALVIHGGQEFVLDFIQRIAKPHQVVARVILPPGVMPNLIGALGENLQRYSSAFGAVPALAPPPPGAKQLSIAEIYEDLKLPDELLSGVYANGAMITHTQAEFCFDFISNLYPRSAVSARVFLAAPYVPGLLQSMSQSFQQFQQKVAAAQQKKPPS